MGARVPEPLRWHRPRHVEVPAEFGLRWDFEGRRAPYSECDQVDGILAPGVPLDTEPTGGPILLLMPRVLDPNSFAELTWLQCRWPWISLTVQAPRGLDAGILGSALTRLARGGAIVLPHDATISDAVHAVGTVFEPFPDILQWLGCAAPRWRFNSRAKAVDQLQGIFNDTDPDHRLTSRRPASRTKSWTQVARALNAARVLQSSNTAPIDQLPTGYHDGRSLRRALRRAFGLGIADIRGTVGWRWLLWRFLCGVGTGKSKAWDRNL